jgi:uncharacterized membrane protein SpoIIM required for sporulation
MKLADAARSAGRAYWSRPSGLLPYYLLGVSTTAVSQTVWLAGLTAAYLTASAQGTLAPIRQELAAVGPIQIDDPSAAPDQFDGLGDAMAAAMTPELLAILAVTALVLFVASIAVDAVVSAGQIHAGYGVLRGRDPIRKGVDGVARDYRTFLVLAVLQVLSMVAVSVALVGAAAATAAGTGNSLLGGALLVLWPLALLGVWLLFLFTEQAVVVGSRARNEGAPPRPSGPPHPGEWPGDPRPTDERRGESRPPTGERGPSTPAERSDRVGAIEAVRRNLGFLRANVVSAAVYAVFAIGVVLVLGVMSAALSSYQASAVGSLAGLLVAFPLLDLVKTALYADHATGRFPTPPASGRSARSRLTDELRDGIAELRAFVRSTPALQAASAAVFAFGVAAGWRLAAGLDGYFRASIAARLSDWFPPAAFLGLAANNWQVSIAQAYAGFLAGVPTLATLLFNGLNIGVVFRLEVDRLALLTFIAPHGVLEIPALVVSGALGLYLGRVGLGVLTGRTDRETAAGAVEHSYRVLIGLAVAFLIAGAIEAFVSPYYGALLGL